MATHPSTWAAAHSALGLFLSYKLPARWEMVAHTFTQHLGGRGR